MNLLDYTKELIITLYPDGQIFYANKTAQIVFGISENEWSSKKLVDIISENNYFDITQRILSSNGQSRMDDVVLKKADGTEFFAHIQAIRINETSGELAVYITDLTYRYEFRKEIAHKVKIIEQLGKSSKVRNGTIDEALEEILEKSLYALNVARVNVWLTDKNITSIECLGSYCFLDDQKFINASKGTKLQETDYPRYFSMLRSAEVIATDDVMNDDRTSELVDGYLVPNSITSMLDIPLRSNGQMIGVICFEHTGHLRKWNVFEIKFGVLIAQIISLLIEGYEKSKLLRKQARLIKEKDELFIETTNRARYIFGLMNSIIALDEKLCKDDYHKNLFVDVKNNLLNISGVHEIMLNAKDYAVVNMEKKFLRIAGYMHNLYPHMQNIELEVKVNHVHLHISKALTLGLLVNQLIQISYEHSFKTNPEGKIIITLHTKGNSCVLTYRDNGLELSEDHINGNLLELRLAEIFATDIEGIFDITTGSGNKFTLTFPLEQTKPASEIPVN